MIIKKLDHESKKQMMATCKRFERLIGQTHQFYKNFKLNWNELRIEAKAHHCKKIQRRFGSVRIFGTLFISQDSRIMEIVKRIGENVIDLHLDSLQTSDTVFLKLMKLLSDLRELTISGSGDIFESGRSRLSPDFKLTNLIKLELYDPKNLQLLGALVPASLKFLKMRKWTIKNQTCWDTEILCKQTGLEELILRRIIINFSGFEVENCHIKKLKISELSFLNQFAFKKFADFMKIQESVVELMLEVDEEELKTHDYAGTLTHLLSLKSLKKLTFGCQYENEIFNVFSKINLYNPAVDTLTIKNLNPEADLKSLPKFFPNVSDLKIYSLVDEFAVDLKPINSMTKIRKLEIEYILEEMLVQLELKEMREFLVFEESEFIQLASWKTFIENNSKLEILHMPYCKIGLQHLLDTLENLPLLKSLELTVDGFTDFLARYDKEHAEKAAKLIGENYHRFEHLKLEFYDASGIERNILDFLGKYYPGVKLHK
jgi:hypothetical protein